MTGSLTDGTTLKADVDTQDHFLARRIERFWKGKSVGIITTTGSLAAGAIAQKSVYNAGNQVEVYQFKKADFGAPNASEFQFPLQGRMRILDQRLGTMGMIRKNSTGTISKQDLLVLTRKAQAKRIRGENKARTLEKIQSALNVSVLVLPVLIFGVWFSYSWSKRGRHEKSI